MAICSLPDELIHVIAEYLGPKDLCELAGCCKQLQCAIHSFRPYSLLKIHLPDQTLEEWPNTILCQWIAEKHQNYEISVTTSVYMGYIDAFFLQPIDPNICSTVFSRKKPFTYVDCYQLEEYPKLPESKFPNIHYTITLPNTNGHILIFPREFDSGFKCIITSIQRILTPGDVETLQTHLQCHFSNSLKCSNIVVFCKNEYYAYNAFGGNHENLGWKLICAPFMLIPYKLTKK